MGSEMCIRDSFYPRSPCGERRAASITPTASRNFYPRSPCGERRVTVLGIQHRVGISIHALLAESDHGFLRGLPKEHLFLSTLSLRRATCGLPADQPITPDFYPRSPCGERLRNAEAVSKYMIFLSTLSLRRATLVNIHNNTTTKFLSTLSLRRATFM